MLNQPVLRALRASRTPLSTWAQPFAPLRPSPLSTHLSRTLQTSAPRTPPTYNSRHQTQRLQPLPQSQHAFRTPRTPFSPASSFQSGRRPFSSGFRFQYQQNRYNRFDGGGRPSLIHILVNNARPHHFVIIGVVISGVYLYNTDVVEVRYTSQAQRTECLPEAKKNGDVGHTEHIFVRFSTYSFRI